MKLGDFVVEYLGRTQPDYFQGYGVAFTEYKHCVVGVGCTIADALDDCIDMFAQSTDIEITTEIEKRIFNAFGDAASRPATGDLLYHVGIKWNEIT